MIWILIWAAVGFLLGLCLIILVPWTAARMAGRDWIEEVSDRYIWLAQTCARRSALIVRDGDIKLVPKRYDSDLKADKDTQTGDKRHHRDDFGVISRLKAKVFGIGLTSRDTYVSPLLAELGEEAKRAQERNEIGPQESAASTDKFVDGIHIPKRSQLVDLSAAKHLTTGASEPESGQDSYKKTKISQEKFHDRVSFGQGLLIIVAAVASMGVAWFGASRGGGGVEAAANATTVSMLLLATMETVNQRVARILLGSVATAATAVVAVYIFAGPSAVVYAIAVAFVAIGIVAAAVITWIELDPDLNGTNLLSNGESREGKAEASADFEALLSDAIEWVQAPNYGKGAAIAWIVGWIFVIPIIAAVTYGLAYAALVFVIMLGTALGITGFIALMAPSIPVVLGMGLAKGFWILAQLTVSRGVIVERDSGELEHRMLAEAPEDADHDFEARLSDGKLLEIDGSKGDLVRFAWAPIAATAEKSEENMGTITEHIPAEAATDGGTVLPANTRQGYQPEIRVADRDEYLVTLPQLWTLCEDTCESTSVRQGRQKALTEHGGEQQISLVVFMAMLLGAIALGGTFGLIAGGAIL